jgi:flagellar L-ring protein precursor FlgH
MGRGLFCDHKARKVGDIVTVLVQESSTALSKTSTKRAKDAKIEAGPKKIEGNLLGFLPPLGFKSKSSYKGSGATVRTGTLLTKVSATIIEVLPDGTLLIEGRKRIIINAEEQLIEVSGLIRPEDIREDNTVLSTRIADARIYYQGKLIIVKKEKPNIIIRVLTKILNFLF